MDMCFLVTGTGMTAFRGKQTLQTMCFFKLVNELEDFMPDSIFAQLPTTLCHMLLLKLPAVDVIKLESTSVVIVLSVLSACCFATVTSVLLPSQCQASLILSTYF